LKKIHLFVFMVVCSLGWPMAHAQDAVGDSIDCTDVRVDYVDDPSLTHAERLRLMDKAFRESLEKFELCRSAKEAAAASKGAAGNGATADSGESTGGSGDSSGQAGGTSANESAASSVMSGTEAPEKDSAAQGTEAAAQGGLQDSQNQKKAGGNTGGRLNQSNGKLPEDIPPAQNDDALAAQIRYAAENETDPVKREQLWNEYRKYKGLPIQ
jgi:hypothetical protein